MLSELVIKFGELTIWNCKGIILKFKICTAGQSMKFALSAGRYTSWNLRPTARRPPPLGDGHECEEACQNLFPLLATARLLRV